MKRKNLQAISVLTSILFLLFFVNSYSQWVPAGSITNPGTTPSISVVDQNIAWVAGGTGTPSVSRTTNGGTNWTVIPTTGISFEVYCVWGIDANTCYVGDGGSAGGGGGNAKLYKTTDAGVTWTVAAQTGGTAGFFNGVVFSRTNPLFGIAQSDPPNNLGNPYYLAITTDGGITWNPNSQPIPGVSGQASAQNSVVVIDDQFYGFGLGNTTPARSYMTSNGGASWYVGSMAAIGTASGFVSALAFSDNKLNGIGASSASLPNIARTTDGGVTWSVVNVGANFTVYCTAKWISGTNTCYISAGTGTAGVVKKSTDAGLTWTTQTTSGLNGITHMEFKRVGTTVYGYAATSLGVILKLTDIVTDVNTVNSLVPTEYLLAQNYPNPFNPTTTIKFSIPSSSNVTLKVYNALGKEVATLVDEFKNAGNYSTDFNATSGLTSGIYFYTITAGNFTDTKKLMLVK